MSTSTMLRVHVILASHGPNIPRRVYAGKILLGTPSEKGVRPGDRYHMAFGLSPMRPILLSRPSHEEADLSSCDFLVCPTTPAVELPRPGEDRRVWNARLKEATELATWSGAEEAFFTSDPDWKQVA